MRMFEIIRYSLWNDQTTNITITRENYNEMKRQAIAVLPALHLSSIGLSPKLKQEWKQYILHQMAYGIKCKYAQSTLPISVPYTILKGTSAAMYYPYPEYRTMGDIDIMTRREDFDAAYQQLLNNGYRVMKELNREVSLIKNGIVVELHHRFATLSDPELAKYLDDLIIDNITPSHVLPDSVNGLVLLEHIDQHMEGGLGLRQIIDWMMFVDKCLPDDKWQEFDELVTKVGLKTLAIVTTRMCEMYLGLPPRKWCATADDKLCKQLMDYVLSCGNFGNKKTTDADISINAMSYARTPKTTFKLLQKQGLQNWKIAQKHSILKPIAWIYQLNRYAVKGLKRENALSKFKEEYVVAKKRSAMFEALGIHTASKGTVNLIDGKYVKE